MIKGPMPDLTPAQILAVVGWAVAQLVAFGVISNERAQLATSIGATVLAAILKAADAYLRGKRNQASRPAVGA